MRYLGSIVLVAALAGGASAQIPLRQSAPVAAGVSAQEMAYGQAPLEKLDFYPAASASPAPLVLFIHGGGWSRGDKRNATGESKIAYFRTHGFAFASIDYRMVPAATVEDEAQDVADALAYLLRNAGKLGIAPQRVVLIGHSAGAHLAALVGTDPRYLAKAGLSEDALSGVILLDGAAYDVPAQMRDGPGIMHSTYVAAFGTDPARQRLLSPTLHAEAPNAPAFLILHIDRPDGTRQSEALGAALKVAGTPVEVQGVPGFGLPGHMAINREFGQASQPATRIAGEWLARVVR